MCCHSSKGAETAGAEEEGVCRLRDERWRLIGPGRRDELPMAVGQGDDKVKAILSPNRPNDLNVLAMKGVVRSRDLDTLRMSTIQYRILAVGVSSCGITCGLSSGVSVPARAHSRSPVSGSSIPTATRPSTGWRPSAIPPLPESPATE